MVFKLNFKDKEIVIPVSSEDHTIITIHDKENVSYLSASTFGKDLKQHIWENSSIGIDDSITVQIAEANEEISQPIQTVAIEKVIRKSKLETFIELENDLKQRGLL